MRREISRTELRKIISYHESWLRCSKRGKRADLSDCIISDVVDEMRDKKLEKAILVNVFFEQCNMHGCDFTKAAMQGARFLRCGMELCDFSQADLHGVHLTASHGSDVGFTDADLTGARVAETFLRGSNFQGADLRDADLGYSNLMGSLFYDAKGLDTVNWVNTTLFGAQGIYRWAQVAFEGHGHSGRVLTGIQAYPHVPTKFFCGCVKGVSEKELMAYIEDPDGAKWRRSRLTALKTVKQLMKVRQKR